MNNIPDITTAEFTNEVINNNTPVIVDFWAPWCEPCKQIEPILKKTADKFPNVKLVRMNIEEYPEVSAQLRIQSIPTIVAFFDGKPIDAITGAVSEDEITKFITKIANIAENENDEPPQLIEALEQAEKLAEQGEQEIEQALQIFMSILAQFPENEKAIIGAAKIWIKKGEKQKVKEIMKKINQESKIYETIQKILELAEQAENLGDLKKLEEKSNKEPNNHQARFEYALGLNGAGQKNEAAQQLIEIIQKDKKWNDEKARKQLIEFFQAWGQNDEETIKARKKLSAILFS